VACLRWASVGNDNVERGAVRGLGLMFLALFLLLKSRSFVVVQDLLFSTQSGCAGRWIKKPSARAGESDIEIFAIDSQAFAVDVGRTTRTPATAESPPEFFFLCVRLWRALQARCRADSEASRAFVFLFAWCPNTPSSRQTAQRSILNHYAGVCVARLPQIFLPIDLRRTPRPVK